MKRFLGRHEIPEIRLHRGRVGLRLGVRELRDRDRGEDADDHDDDQQFDEREAFPGVRHTDGPVSREARRGKDERRGGSRRSFRSLLKAVVVPQHPHVLTES